MLLKFLQKKSDSPGKTKREIIEMTIFALNIPKSHKDLLLGALDNASEETLDKMYKELLIFAEKTEMKDYAQIEEENFSVIAGMTKKQANQKKEEINSFNFLLNNL